MAQQMDEVDYTWCRSRRNVYTVSFRWKIDHFRNGCGKKTGDLFYSSDFWAEEAPEIKWRLKLYPRGETIAVRDYVSIYLTPITEIKVISAKYSIAILDVNHEESHILNTNSVRTFSNDNGWGSRKFIQKNYLISKMDEWLPNDTLTIFCKIRILSETLNFKRENLNIVGGLFQGKRLNCKLKNLLTSKAEKDVIFNIGERSVSAHKCLLSSISDTFKDMFEKSEEGRVHYEIEDVKYITFKKFLDLIYMNSKPDLEEEELAKDLLLLACRFKVRQFKALCEENVAKFLNPQNLSRYLLLAIKQDAARLKSDVMEFIVNSPKFLDIVKRPEWEALKTEAPGIMEEIFELLTSCDLHPTKRMKKE